MAETDIWEHLQRIGLAMHSVTDGLWDWDLSTARVFYSPRWMAMLGYAAGELPGVVETWRDLLVDEDRDCLQRFVQSGSDPTGAHSDRVEFSAEARMRHKHGHLVDVLVRGVVCRDDNGAAVRAFGTLVDVSSTRSAERALVTHRDDLERLVAERTAALEQATAYNRSLFDSSPVGLALRDLSTRELIDANQAYLNIIGYTADEAKALPFDAACPPHLQPKGVRFSELLRSRTGYPVSEAEYIHKDGHQISVQLFGNVVELQGRACLLSAVQDISEHKRMRSSSSESQARLTHAQSIARVGSWQVDVVSGEVELSVESMRILGAPTGTDVSARHYWSCVHPDDVADLKAEIRKARAANAQLDVSHRIVLDGCEKWVRVQAEFHRGADNDLILTFGTIQDITEVKAAESAMAMALAETRRLAQLRSDFMANMSHEVRTPLNGVLGFAQLGARATTLARAQTLFDRIGTSGLQLLKVVDDVLDFSKAEAGKVALEASDFEIRRAVDEAIELFREEASKKGLSLESTVDQRMPVWVVGDRFRIGQVVNNLLSNALKFTEAGRVELSVRPAADRLEIHVVDTGLGVEADRLADLFNPFEQADGSITRRFGGTGLGLSISRTLARQMGGDISVTSAPGEGSRFVMSLPLALGSQVAANDPDDTDAGSQRLAGLRVLVVDDEPPNRLLLQEFFRLEGAICSDVSSGDEALAMLENNDFGSYDIVLMDIQMPGLDGYETTRRLLRRAPGLAIVGLSARALAEDRERSLACGMAEHIAKPVDFDILRAAIVRLSRRRSRDEGSTSTAGNTTSSSR